MHNAAYVIIPFLVVIVMLGFGWWWARRVKKDFDTGVALGTPEPLVLHVPPASAAQLRALSSEPLLLKQDPDGLRVQIESRPMVPVALFAGKDIAVALMESAVLISESLGPQWATLVSAAEDGTLSVRLLA
jgi:hypothetical protein